MFHIGQVVNECIFYVSVLFFYSQDSCFYFVCNYMKVQPAKRSMKNNTESGRQPWKKKKERCVDKKKERISNNNNPVFCCCWNW